jgi:predicted AAA+ superfamily ATPase
MYIAREIDVKIKNHLDKKEYTILTGARQTGKTTLITNLFKELKTSGEHVYYLTLENADVLRDVNESPENIFKYALRPTDPLVQNTKTKRVIVFIDEIQYADNPSHVLKYLYDKYLENLKIVATGSSAFYLDSTFKDSLAGRKRIFIIKTLNFGEFLHFINRNDLSDVLQMMRHQPDFISMQKEEMLEKFNQYLIYGGYPSVVLEPDLNEKVELLKELKNSFLKRDIDESGVNNPDAFYKLAMILSSQTGNLVNKNEFSNTLRIDNKTIDRYLFVLQKCFHIELIKPFSQNLRKELTKMPMIYFYDSGMRNSMLNRFFEFDVREDKGQLLENFVFRRLKEKYDTDDIRFWRTTDNKEIDFIIDSGEGRFAYEVKFSCKQKKGNASKVFLENYPDFTYKTISYDFDAQCLQALKL